MSSSSSARVVVAIDFGTTFSGFAYAKTSDPDKVFTFYQWPKSDKVGAKSYCKTQTSLYYAPSKSNPARFELKDWGWPSLLHFTDAANLHASALPHHSKTHLHFKAFLHGFTSHSKHSNGLLTANEHDADLLMSPLTKDLAKNVGFFATKFKLHFASGSNIDPNKSLVGNITVERLMIDYLRCLSNFIIAELQVMYGKNMSKKDVQWCLTVPAIWDERAKQLMKTYAEKAGMVKDAKCQTHEDASPYPVDIILEPEAASIFCQQKANFLNIKQGDKMLIADVGGGTIDIVVHEKANNNAGSMEVHEVVASYGEVGGGTYVDSHFFHFLSQKIGCFRDFCCNNTSICIDIYAWWQRVKLGFDGDGYSVEYMLPGKLRDAWEKYDKEHDVQREDKDYYDVLRLEDKDFRSIFDPEVEKVLSLIEQQIEGVRVLMVVGGFSASPYLRKRIQSRFKTKVDEVIIPEDPGSAICNGAVQLHMSRDLIQSRIAKRTYGVESSRIAKPGDPREYLYVNDDGITMCKNTFNVFVRAGERVSYNKSIKKVFGPNRHRDRAMTFSLYSSPNLYPKYTTEHDAIKEGSFLLDTSKGLSLDKMRRVETSMCFGASFIHVTSQPLNFEKARKELPSMTTTFQA